MPTKIVQFGPWRRDGNYYDMSGQGGFLLQAMNVTPTDGGYTGPVQFNGGGDVAIGATTYDDDTELVDAAFATENNIYGSLRVEGTGDNDILIRAPLSSMTFEDATGTTKWTGDIFGTSFCQWGDFVIAAGAQQKVQFINDTSGTGTNFSDLCVTTAPTGATAGATADLRAKFAFPYRDHLVLANISLVADYPASNPIYTGNATVGSAKNYGSLIWISMSDNIRRYASPVAHPEVKGSLPMNLVDGAGSITGVIGGENAYIFKQDRVYQLTGPPFDAAPIADGIGTISPGSIIRVKNDVYFLSNHGPAVIQGGAVSVLGYERFMSALTEPRHEAERLAGWVGPTTSKAMLGKLLQNEGNIKRVTSMYSDALGCVVWFLRGGQWIACRVNGSGDMSFGNSGDFFHGSTPDGVMLSVTATAKMPNWLSDSFPIRNIVFRQANEANNVNVHYVYEDYSGFEGRTVPTNGAFHFTLPMMPLAASEDGGILPTRITGFRIIGECNRNVRATMVRTLSGWNSDPKIADRSGDRMQSMDGWVNTPNTYAGRLHSLSFMIHDDREETEYIRRPFFSGVEIGYEVIVGRSA